MKARRVIVASSNAGKLAELTVLLAPLGFDLTPQQELDIESPPETGLTFLDNALIKARHAAAARGLPAIADDSGIEVDALGKAPGVRSARFAGEGKHGGRGHPSQRGRIPQAIGRETAIQSSVAPTTDWLGRLLGHLILASWKANATFSSGPRQKSLQS